MVITYSKGKDQPGKVANLARDELNREMNTGISLFPFAPENLVSRDGFGSPVPRQPAHLHTQAEYGAYLRDSRVRLHRASKPQGSSERVLPWQVTMGQLICASLSHTHYWHEVGMLKVLAFIVHNNV